MVWNLLELAGLLILPAALAVDLIWRDKRYATPRFWHGRAALVSLANVYLAGYVAVFWSGVFGSWSLFNLSGLNPWLGAAVGVLVYQFIHYWYHRLAHGWDPLWRVSHQMHHSAEAVDAFGAYYLHPVDNFLFTTWASLTFFPLLGLGAEAGLAASVFLTVNAVFQHMNIRTPHWLGYWIQRPESHRIHHAAGVHRYNYADLPLMDILFGTFRNPRAEESAPSAAGFRPGASAKIWDMLLFKDVSA